jgi:hypothetical protein
MNGAGFHYLKEIFRRGISSKIKEGTFDGSQIRALIRNGKFEYLLSKIKKFSWKSFKSVMKFFLGNRSVSQLP